MLRTILIVGTGGFIGSALRYIIHVIVEKGMSSTFPWATFIANILGCFIIGIVYAISEKGNLMNPEWRVFLTVGFCGGFTTFSSFAYNNLNLLKDNSLLYLLLNAGGSLFLGILAVYIGIVLVRSII
ncbi:MAG: fluoride efflux transporter CrcB [Prolixibacteraceae bacterium]|nr:fluoride efflux transporter CrcB [Prolixibacteraceae bacterium]